MNVDRLRALALVEWFGFRFVRRSASEACIALSPRPEHLQTGGSVHGGVLATLADTAAVWLVQPELPPGRDLTSIEFKLNFLRAARADGGEVEARATLLKAGRSVAVCEVEVRQADVVVAKGLFTYLLLG